MLSGLTGIPSQLEPIQGVSNVSVFDESSWVGLLGMRVDLLQHVQYES